MTTATVTDMFDYIDVKATFESGTSLTITFLRNGVSLFGDWSVDNETSCLIIDAAAEGWPCHSPEETFADKCEFIASIMRQSVDADELAHNLQTCLTCG